MTHETTTTDRAAKGAPITDTTTTREGDSMITDTTTETITITITTDALAVMVDALRAHSAQCHRDAVKMSEAAARLTAKITEAHADEPHESLPAVLALNDVPAMWSRVRTAGRVGAAADRVADGLTDALRFTDNAGTDPDGRPGYPPRTIPGPGTCAARVLDEDDAVRVIDID